MSSDVEKVKYRGCTLVIGPSTVVVYAPDGREIDTVRSVSTARRVVKGYRRAGT